jgi:hypothetical protein
MVAEVIVPIADRDVEGDATVELLEVCGDVILGSLAMQEFGEFQVTHSFAVVLA